MNKSVVAAVSAVLVLGGGSLAFVIWRSAQEKTGLVGALIDEVQREITAPSSTSEDRRALLKRVIALRAQIPDTGLTLAEGELLAALGRAQDGWTAIESIVTAPGASDQATLVGSRVAAAAYAVTGNPTLGQQALALASDAEHRGGGEATAFLGWQLAFRIGDVDAWCRRTLDAIDSGATAGDRGAMRSCARLLAELLASRLGFDTSRTDGGGVSGSLADVIAKAPKSSRRELEQVALSRGGTCAEIELAVATATLDEVGTVGAAGSDANETERALRAALARVEVALTVLPSSLEARHVAVIAFAGLRQFSGLSVDDTTRLRGFLQWLLTNAPATHVARPVWEALLRSLG